MVYDSPRPTTKYSPTTLMNMTGDPRTYHKPRSSRLVVKKGRSTSQCMTIPPLRASSPDSRCPNKPTSPVPPPSRSSSNTQQTANTRSCSTIHAPPYRSSITACTVSINSLTVEMPRQKRRLNGLFSFSARIPIPTPLSRTMTIS